jgi:hypothetical protein
VAEASSSLRIRSWDGIVHAMMYVNDRAYTLCRRQGFAVLGSGGRYCTYSSPVVTCLTCLSEGGADG